MPVPDPSRRRFLLQAAGAAAGWALLPGPLLRRAIAAGAAWRLSAELLARLPGRLEETRVPGIAIGLAPGEGGPRVHALGSRRAGAADPVEADTIFPAGSLSKPVLATVALELAARERFDLDEPIAAWLDADLPSGPGAEAITARHALSHASGLPNWRFTLETPLETTFEPGAKWSYSGEGYVLVQRALEAVTGRALDDLAREIVFEPLGMSSTSYVLRPELADRRAIPAVPADDRFADYAALFAWKGRALAAWAERSGRDVSTIPLDEVAAVDPEVNALAAEMAGRTFPDTPPLPNFLIPNGAGTLSTTAGDYARFLAAWLERDDLRARAFANPAPVAGDVAWGLGWGLDLATDPPSFWHWGEGLGYRSLAYADPGAAQALDVFANGNRGLDLAREIFEDATGRPLTVVDAV